ncbi:hypothetical protein FRB98_008871 [Tulasnella sp. 332]|nr:hypothetical protein FRB98_008871 [Tulasnella sp. 332]
MGRDDDDTVTQPSNLFTGGNDDGGGREAPGSGRGTNETDYGGGSRRQTHTNKTSSGSNNDPSSPTSAGSHHERIGSTSTTTSRPEGYPSWLPRRPAGPVPAGSSVGERTRPGTAAGTWVDSPYDVGAGLELEDAGTLDLGEYGDARRAEEEEGDDVEQDEDMTEGPIAGPSTSPAGGERNAASRAVRIVRVPGGGVQQHHVQQSTAVTAMGESREASDSTRVPSASYHGITQAARSSPIQPLSPTVVNTFGSRIAPPPQPFPPSPSTAPPRRVRHSIPLNAPPPPPAAAATAVSQYVNNRRSSFYPQQSPPPQPPRFRARKFHPTLLRRENLGGRVAWYIWCIFVAFGGVVLQTFLDFNVAYMLGQIVKHPSPTQTTHDWTLALVAYTACWFLWVFGVWMMYEVVYSFWRRWRAKRPLLTPIYLSSAAYTFVCMTSYTNYCFLRHLRWSGLYVPIENDGDLGGVQDGKAMGRREGAKEKQREVDEGHDDEDDEKRASRMRGGADAEGDTREHTPEEDEDDQEQHRERRTSQPRNHRRSTSQAQTQTTSSKQHGRSFSLSDGRPAISELASSERSESREQHIMPPPGHIDLSNPEKPIPVAAGEKERSESGSRSRAEDEQRGRTSGEKQRKFPSFSSPLPSPAQIKSRFMEQFTNTSPSSGNGGTSRVVGARSSPLAAGGAVTSQTHNASRLKQKWSYDLKQFVAESCWMYSQNGPTVVLLLPRMGIALALYLATRSSSSGAAGVAGLGRDHTWFNGGGQGLTTYGDLVLWFTMLWGLWRVILLIVSWLGLWAFSGMACAGICGPRYRWEEVSFDEDRERTSPEYAEDEYSSQQDHARPQRYNQQPPPTADPLLSSAPMPPAPRTQPARSRMSTYSTAQSSYVPGGGRGARFRNPDDHKLNWPWMERCVDRIAEVWEECVVVDQRRPMRGLGITYGKREQEEQDNDDVEDEDQMAEKMEHGGIAAATAAPPLIGRPSSGTPAAYRGFPGVQQGYGYESHYAPLDGTVLSTLQEVSSTHNTPSVAPTAPSMPIPAAVSPEAEEPPLVLPIFSAAGSKRVPLTKDLFVAPDPPVGLSSSGSESWLGSSAVPLSFPAAAVTTATSPSVFTYPMLSTQQLQVKSSSTSQSQLSLSPKKNPSTSRTPSFRPSNASRTPTPLPFPLTTGPTSSPERATAEHMFPTPATTISLLPFPFHQGAAAPPGGSPTDDIVAPREDEDHTGELPPMSPYDEEIGYPPSHAGSAGAATGSMSSLGQPIQSLYHLGGAARRTSASGRGSAASGSSPIGGLGSRPTSGSHQHLPHYGQRTPSLSMSGGSGSGSAPPSAYGAAAARVRSRSDLSRSVEAYDDDYIYDDDEGSQLSSPMEAGIAGVGAGGGMGPRRSLVNIIAQQHPVIAPPPRRQGSSPPSGRRRAGTLPAHASPLETAEHPTHARGPSLEAGASGSFRSRVASVPAPPSPGLRGFFSPNSPSEHGHDDEDDEGSQEAAERDDSVGLLSPSSRAPSRRTSLVGMGLVRGRGSSFSLHHRWSDSHSNSSGAPRSRAGSFVPPVPRSRRSSDHSYSSMSETYNTPSSMAPDPAVFARARAAVAGTRQRTTDTTTSRYTDARSSRVVSENSTGGSDSREGLERNNDHTFGVQVNWNLGEPHQGEHQGGTRSLSPRREDEDPPTIRQRTSTTSSNFAGVRRQSLVHPRSSPSSSNVDLASRSSRNGQPIDA